MDATLIESAGNLISPLITAAGPFITMAVINSFVKILLGKMVCINKISVLIIVLTVLLQKSGSQVAERSFIIGTLAEVRKLSHCYIFDIGVDLPSSGTILFQSP